MLNPRTKKELAFLLSMLFLLISLSLIAGVTFSKISESRVYAKEKALVASRSCPKVVKNKSLCKVDSDCLCATDVNGQCGYLNRCYVEANGLGPCTTSPDFCSGITGNCAPGCVRGSCTLVCPSP